MVDLLADGVEVGKRIVEMEYEDEAAGSYGEVKSSDLPRRGAKKACLVNPSFLAADAPSFAGHCQ